MRRFVGSGLRKNGARYFVRARPHSLTLPLLLERGEGRGEESNPIDRGRDALPRVQPDRRINRKERKELKEI